MKKRYKCKQCYAINIDAYDHCVSCGAPLKHPKSTLFRVVFHVLGLMGLYIGLQALLGIIVTIPVFLKNIDSAEVIDGIAIFDHSSDAILTSIVLSAVLFISIIVFYFYRRRFSVRPLYRFDKIGLTQLIWAVIIGFGCIFLSQVILAVSEYVGILSVDTLKGYEEEMAALIGQSPVWLIVLTVGIIAPIAEELLFRGLILHLFNRHLNIRPALIIQGILFGLFHLNLVQGLYASVTGIAMGMAYVFTGSLWVPILIHIVNNTSAVLLPDSLMNDPVIYMMLLSLMLLVPLGLWVLYRENQGKYILDLNA